MYPLNLGNLIDKLNNFMPEYKGSPIKIIEYGEDMDWSIKHDIGVPCCWRGSYSELTIPPSVNKYTVSSFLNILENEVLNQTFTGYKGGDYVMHENVFVYADPYSCANGSGIIDVTIDEDDVVLVVAQCFC